MQGLRRPIVGRQYGFQRLLDPLPQELQLSVG
jgi:hypothetical protein